MIATPATIRSHAYFSAIKDENPAVEVYEHATPALVPLVEAGELAGRWRRPTVAEALAPLLGERDAAGESIFPRPPGATIDTLLLGCTHYPLLRPIIAAQVGDGRRDRRLGDRDRLGPGRAARRQRPRGARRRPPVARRRPTSSSRPATRTRFARRSPAACSAPDFPDVEPDRARGRWPDDGPAATDRRPRRGATTASGRPGS